MNVHIDSTTDTAEDVKLATAGITKEAEPAPLAADAAEGETKEVSETSEEGDSAEAGKLEAKEGEENDGEEKRETPKGFKKRIDKLTKRAALAEQEANLWKTEALKAKPAPVEATPELIKPATMEASGKPVQENFDTHQEYLDALTDWKVDQKLSQRDQAEKAMVAKVQFEQRLTDHRAQAAEFQKTHTDFQDVIEEIKDVAWSPAIQDAVLDNGPEFIYEMAKNPEEFKRINSLGYAQTQREIGKLEERLAAAKQEKSETKKLTTKAPQPIAPVGSRASASQKNPDDMSFSEYKQWREANS